MSSTELSFVPNTKLQGKTVAKTKLHWVVERDLPQFLEVTGARLVDNITPELDVLLVERQRGIPAQEKEALKLNKKGANIQILTVDELRDLMQPTRDDLIRVLRNESPELKNYFILCHSMFFRVTTDLDGADFSNLEIRDYILEEVNFNDANFSNARLSSCALGEINGANFDNASLDNIKFKGADNCSFKGATLNEVGIGGTGGSTAFVNCTFQNATISGKHIWGHWSQCDFQGADLRNASMWGEFKDCNFSGANMSAGAFLKALFKACDLSGCDLSGSKLAGADFTGANLRGANLRGADLTRAQLTGAMVDDADFTGATLIDTALGGVDLSRAKGSATAKTEAPKFAGALLGLSTLAQRAYVATTIMLELKNGTRVKAEIEAYPGMSQVSAKCDGKELYKESYKQLAEGMAALVEAHPEATLCWDTVTTAYTGTSSNKKELQKLALNAWYQAWGQTPPAEEELKKELKKRKKSAEDEKRVERDEWVAKLKSGAEGLAAWNKRLIAGQLRPLNPFDGMDLHGMSLPEVRLQTLSLKNGNFENTSMKDGRLDFTDLHHARFCDADLSGVNFRAAKAADSDFSKARLSKADFGNAILSDAKFPNADLTGASFAESNIQGADFTGAKLEDTVWHGARFDEKTVFPKGYVLAEGMMWAGRSSDPRGLQELAAITAAGPLDFDTFMANLRNSFDPEKLAKATKMLKADKFQLFAEVTDTAMLGVVKSQNDPDLVYSCRLSSDGGYFCCTQNLNVCGGLRGSICKHLLVLLVGLTKANQMDPNNVIGWVVSSKRQLPRLDKEAASATFLRYKGAEAGEVDWRPTETIPEDYYAF